MASSISADPREASRATSPADMAAANADDTATRHAMFENGRSLVNNHVYTVQTG